MQQSIILKCMYKEHNHVIYIQFSLKKGILNIQLTDAMTPPTIAALRLCLFENLYLVYNLRPIHTGIPAQKYKICQYKNCNLNALSYL